MQVLQELLGFTAVGGKVGGNDVHIIAGAHGLFLFLDFHFIEVCDFPFDRLDGFHLIYGLNVHRHDDGGFHIQKIGEDAVAELRGEDLQEAGTAAFAANAEALAGSELKGIRGDKIFDRQPGGSQPVPGEQERLLFVDVQHVVHEPEPVMAVQRLRRNAQPLEVVENIRFDTFQPRLGVFECVGFNPEGDVFCLNQTIVSAGELVLKHGSIFFPQRIERILLLRNCDTVHVAFLVCREVYKRELEVHRAVKVIQEVTPPVEDRGFVLVLVELIVDVLKLNGLAVIMIRHAADTIREHPLKRDAVLCGFLLLIASICPRDGRLDLLSFGAGEFSSR